MLTDFDYNLLPENYTLCLHDACPRAKECLRRAIAEGVPAAHTSIRVFSPAAARQMAAAGCTYFRPIRKVRYARGIEAVLKQFEKLPYREARMARATLYGFSDGICSTAYATASVSSSPKSKKRLPHFSAGLV